MRKQAQKIRELHFALNPKQRKISYNFLHESFIREHDILIKLNGEKNSTAFVPCEMRFNVDSERKKLN